MKIIATEHETQNAILDWLTAKRIFHYRNNSGAMVSEYHGKKRFMRFGKVGSPDIVAVIRPRGVDHGQYVGIEVKRVGNNLSEAQIAFKEQLEVAGGKWITAYCLEDVIAML